MHMHMLMPSWRVARFGGGVLNATALCVPHGTDSLGCAPGHVHCIVTLEVLLLDKKLEDGAGLFVLVCLSEPPLTRLALLSGHVHDGASDIRSHTSTSKGIACNAVHPAHIRFSVSKTSDTLIQPG